MTDRAGDTFIVELGKGRLLARAVFCQSAREQGHRRVTTLAMAGEFDAAGAQQNVDTFTVERLARCVAMQGFRPGCVRIMMTARATRSEERRVGKEGRGRGAEYVV